MEHSTARILLVDDDPSLLKMMGVYLGRLGYSVTLGEQYGTGVGGGGGGAFRLCHRRAGREHARQWKTLRSRCCAPTRPLCVVAASGYAMDTAAIEAAAPGRVAVLQKPFAPEMLAAAVRRMLAAQEENL